MPPNAVLRTLELLWATLEPIGIKKALLGGLAMSVHRYARSTQDVDLIVSVDDEEKLFQALSKASFRSTGRPAVRSLGKLRISQWVFEPPEAYVDIPVDILVANIAYQQVALGRAITVTIEGIERELEVLDVEDIILHKALAGRLIDRWDIKQLLERNADAIDWEYLREWAGVLGVTDELAG